MSVECTLWVLGPPRPASTRPMPHRFNRWGFFLARGVFLRTDRHAPPNHFMDASANVARAARNFITAHGAGAERIALARAKNAEESKRDDVANTWRDIAAAVRTLQGRRAH